MQLLWILAHHLTHTDCFIMTLLAPNLPPIWFKYWSTILTAMLFTLLSTVAAISWGNVFNGLFGSAQQNNAFLQTFKHQLAIPRLLKTYNSFIEIDMGLDKLLSNACKSSSQCYRNHKPLFLNAQNYCFNQVVRKLDTVNEVEQYGNCIALRFSVQTIPKVTRLSQMLCLLDAREIATATCEAAYDRYRLSGYY